MTWIRSRTDASAASAASASLLTLGSWKRELYRLLNTEAGDDDLTQHDDASITLEGLLIGIQVGIDDAQEYLLAQGLSGWWVDRTAAITWSGSDDSVGRYVALPSDFRRLAGDLNVSALVKADETRWGQFVEWEDRFRTGPGYYFRDGKLYLLRKANPPDTLYLEYVRRLTVPSNDTTQFSEFPRWALPLIPAFAAVYLMDESFLPGGPELEAKIERRLHTRKTRAAAQLRLHQGPRRIKRAPILGNHFWL